MEQDLRHASSRHWEEGRPGWRNIPFQDKWEGDEDIKGRVGITTDIYWIISDMDVEEDVDVGPSTSTSMHRVHVTLGKAVEKFRTLVRATHNGSQRRLMYAKLCADWIIRTILLRHLACLSNSDPNNHRRIIYFASMIVELNNFILFAYLFNCFMT